MYPELGLGFRVRVRVTGHNPKP